MSAQNISRTRKNSARRDPITEKEGPKKSRISILHLPQQQRSRLQGVVLTCGQGDVGQLGLGENILEKGRPALVNGVENVVAICCGGMHTLCLTSDGKVLSFGCDDEGALGREANNENSFLPGVVDLPGPAVQVTAGDSHSAALLEDGRVFVWGSFRDSSGGMGLTLQGKEVKPIQFLEKKTVVKLASGADHLVMLTRDGQLYTCGCAEQGQLGRVTYRSASRENRQGLSKLLLPGPVTFNRRSKFEFVDIWATTYCTFAKEKSNAIYVFGLNNYNQLGIKSDQLQVFHPTLSESFSPSKTWVKICGGEHHTIALDSDGHVYALGRKEYGRLGLGKDSNDLEVPTIVDTLSKEKCIDIACGSSVSFAVTESGSCYAWGMGSNLQLGMGNEDDVYVPALIKGQQLLNKKCHLIAAGAQHSALLAIPSLSNGSV